jgi:diguanylate cyclase (GGDEF)-like protein/PAS domain S-box-containing protein
MSYQAEANLSALIESTEDLIWSVDLDYRLITYNKALHKKIWDIYGARLKMGVRLHELFSPERTSLWSRFYKRALAQGTFRVEYLLIDGSILELALNPIVVEGKATGISVFGKDITQRIAAESSLQELGKKYRDIFEGAQEGVCQVSPEGKFLTANLAMARMLGYDSPEELISIAGDLAHDVWVNPEDRAQYLLYLEEHGCAQGFECQFKRKDGTPIWVSINDRKVCGPDGCLLYLEGFMEEITERKRTGEALRESEERYRAAFEQAAVGIVHTSFGGKIERCNARFAEIVGYSVDELAGLTFQQLTPPEEMAASQMAIRPLLTGEAESVTWDKRYIRKDGSLTWVRVTTSTQRDKDMHALSHIAIVEDIQAQMEAEKLLTAATEALRLSEERYRTAFQTSIDAININRLEDGKYVDCNRAFLSILGYDRDEVIGRTSQELGIWANPADRQAMAEIVIQNSGFLGHEYQFRKKNGQVFWGEMSASKMEIDGVPCVLSITRDISSAKAAAEEIKSLVFYDALTGLPNRRLLSERLRQALAAGARRNRRQAILFIDLDDFKTLNDTLGHQMGDLLLQEVARRLVATIREADLVCRLGGDELIVMIEDLSDVAEEAAEQAKMVGEKILTEIDQPYMLDGHECHSSASIGIAVSGDLLENANEFLQQADMAMYQAKAAGRNTMRFFSPALQTAVNNRAAMEDDLRQGIKAKQFLLYYQPQVEQDRLTGVEALIRWVHPRQGIMLPDEFIPLAEESRLILQLEEWALETACQQIASWAGHKLTDLLTVAVNVSVLRFRQPEFVEHMLAVLDRTGANPKRLRLEITESMLVENVDEAISKMTELMSHGLRFSLDDFGTGYSSLSYLKRLPLDRLKIDRSFVRDMLADATSGAIAQTIFSLGRAMGISVIAEGVETEEQRGFLAALGCHAFQGFLISPPLSVEQFEAFVQGFDESRGHC